MMTSIDGKVMGAYMDTPQGEAASDVFYNIEFGKNPHDKHQGWLPGWVTTDDNVTDYRKPELDENTSAVPEGDFVVKQDTPMYYVSVDPSGKLGWESGTLTYIDITAYPVLFAVGHAAPA